MVKTFSSNAICLSVEEDDLYVAPSKAMTLLIQAINTTNAAITCELWVTNGSNIHYACIVPSKSIAAYDGVSDVAKHIIPSGFKIRGKASVGSGSVYVEISTLEGL